MAECRRDKKRELNIKHLLLHDGAEKAIEGGSEDDAKFSLRGATVYKKKQHAAYIETD